MNSFDPDHALAIILQAKFNQEAKKKREEKKENVPVSVSRSAAKASLVDPEWEVTDPCPDIHGLFLAFNDRFFWGRLLGVEVKWSPQMTSCAGICVYEGRNGLCSVRLSAPLLKLRPRSDLVETLLHEMIHAYLFVTNNNRDREGHGPEFHKHMNRINQEAGTNITVYHSFHAEVKLYQQHWWRCDGPCQKRPPFFGMVKRARNRAPGPNDFWWCNHQAACGGSFVKIREPEGYGAKGKGKDGKAVKPKAGKDIRNFFKKPVNVDLNANGSSSSNSTVSEKVGINVFGFKNFASNQSAAASIKPSSGVNRVVGFGDLSSKGLQSVSNTPPRTLGGGHVLGRGKESNMKGKNRPLTPLPRGARGGMLANQGGGTLVVSGTKNKNKTDDKPPSPITKLKIDDVKVFAGSGFTLGGSSSNIDRYRSRLLSLGNEPEKKKQKTYVEAPKKHGRNHSSGDLIIDNRNKEDMCKCSVCNKSMSREEIRVHLESCEGLKNVFNNSSVGEDVDIDEISEINKESKITSCPVCALNFEGDINNHLDECLTASGIPKKEDMCKCSVCNKSMPRKEIEIHLESCEGLKNVFNNSSVGDDVDIDEISEINNKSKITSCPVCALNFEGDINNHLDECLTTSGILNIFDQPTVTELNETTVVRNTLDQTAVALSNSDSPILIHDGNTPRESPIVISDNESPVFIRNINVSKPKYEYDSDLEIIEAEKRIACMICGMRFGESRINAHVNECIDSLGD